MLRLPVAQLLFLSVVSGGGRGDNRISASGKNSGSPFFLFSKRDNDRDGQLMSLMQSASLPHAPRKWLCFFTFKTKFTSKIVHGLSQLVRFFSPFSAKNSGPRGRVFKKKLPKVEPLVAKLKEIGAPR